MASESRLKKTQTHSQKIKIKKDNKDIKGPVLSKASLLYMFCNNRFYFGKNYHGNTVGEGVGAETCTSGNRPFLMSQRATPTYFMFVFVFLFLIPERVFFFL